MTKSRLLLTGVTGFLGGAVAAELLRRPEGRNMLLLVRAPSAEDGLARVRKSLQRFDPAAEDLARVTKNQILPGGLADLPDPAAEPRLAEVTRVLNCAAVTSFAQNPKTWPTNVDDTLYFARKVAGLPRLKRFLHTSTAMICGINPPPVVHEDAYPDSRVRHLVGYTGSKAKSEALLREELAGRPFHIVRPSIIIGHTRLGCRPSGSIFWGFRIADALGMVTSDLDARIDVIPVDFSASAILQLLFASQLRHPTYHVSAGLDASSTFREIGRAFARWRGQPEAPDYKRVPYAAVAARQPEFKKLLGPGNERSMLAAARLYGTFAGLNTVFDNARMREAGVPPPPRFSEYVAVCAESCRTLPIAEQMQVDFE